MLSWLLAIGFVIVTFGTLFLYMALGMAISSSAANLFLALVLVPAAMIAAGLYWWRGSRKKEL
jgi:hypothetical protein